MKLVLVRHGNTFGPGDPVVWTGASNDLPLVEKGLEQAHAVGEALARTGWNFQRLYTSGLTRCRTAANIIDEKLFITEREPLCIDDRLAELDLGSWTGLTNEEVAVAGGGEAQTAWNERSEWAAHVFGGTESQIREEVRSFVKDVQSEVEDDATVVVVSSNGRLRYFLGLIPGAFEAAVEAQTFKVKTGNMCLLEFVDGAWQCRVWNSLPQEFPTQ